MLIFIIGSIAFYLLIGIASALAGIYINPKVFVDTNDAGLAVLLWPVFWAYGISNFKWIKILTFFGEIVFWISRRGGSSG